MKLLFVEGLLDWAKEYPTLALPRLFPWSKSVSLVGLFLRRATSGYIYSTVDLLQNVRDRKMMCEKMNREYTAVYSTKIAVNESLSLENRTSICRTPLPFNCKKFDTTALVSSLWIIYNYAIKFWLMPQSASSSSAQICFFSNPCCVAYIFELIVWIKVIYIVIMWVTYF